MLPFASTGDLYVLDPGSKNILRITPTGALSIAVTQAQIKAATQQQGRGELVQSRRGSYNVGS